MMSLIRSGGKPSGQAQKFGRMLRGTDADAVRVAVCLAALGVFALFATSVHADEIEPEPEPAPQVEAEAAPAPAPAPEPAAEVASEDEEPAEPRWIPSIETGFETFDYNTDTTVTNFINAPAWAGTQKEAARQLMFRIGGELMGPEFEDLPGRPRLFVKGGVQIRTFSSDDLYAIGDPDLPGEPETVVENYYLSGNQFLLDLPSEFDGQGGDVIGRIQDPSWYAALGVAFGMPIADNLLLQFKPSIQYSLEKIDMSGIFVTVDEPNPVPDPDDGCGLGQDNPVPCPREFFIHRSRGDASTTDHSVGFGLELAVAPWRKVRPIRVSLYTEARFMWLVSDSTTTFGDSVASFSVSRDKFGVKGGGGLRFSWVGFD
ncbi:MAG: hypothetical protein JRE43_00550 [Deltaproteobacteria bacterium]|jgi:hypothetical protein|nr:hypothetical protein [Deltaproteobacteria bacterium]